MKPSLAQITWVVSTKFQVPQEILRQGKKRGIRGISRSRQVAMYLARRFTGRSYPEIGRWFNRDHTTAIWACRRISELAAAEPTLRQHLEELSEALIPMADKRQRAIQDDVERLLAGEVSWRVGPDKLPPARF